MKFLEAGGNCRRGILATMALLLALPPAAAAAQSPGQSPGDSRESAITDRVLDQYRDLLAQETLAFTISQAVDVASDLHPEVRLNRERLAEFPSLVRRRVRPTCPSSTSTCNSPRPATRDSGTVPSFPGSSTIPAPRPSGTAA